MALLRTRLRAARSCPGCPVYPHIRDRDLRFPSCELCHWPAVGVGGVHVWVCALCRHRNVHGDLRPRISVALLRLAAVDPAALALEVSDVRRAHYLAPPTRPGGHRPRIHPRASGPACDADGLGRGRQCPGGARRPAARTARRRACPGRRPVYARATVAGLPVLIVGGDRPYPHPLGGNEPSPPTGPAGGNGPYRGPRSPGSGDEPYRGPGSAGGADEGWPGTGSLGSRATRIACPCDQPSPCLRAQALYAHVIAWPPGGGRTSMQRAPPQERARP
jgi:hypothetical protein